MPLHASLCGCTCHYVLEHCVCATHSSLTHGSVLRVVDAPKTSKGDCSSLRAVITVPPIRAAGEGQEQRGYTCMSKTLLLDKNDCMLVFRAAHLRTRKAPPAAHTRLFCAELLAMIYDCVLVSRVRRTHASARWFAQVQECRTGSCTSWTPPS